MQARSQSQRSGLRMPVRNRYFYGKLLDVYHFELETRYANDKRWLLNRIISGFGVVCGLDVRVGAETDQLWIEPGVAIDKWGREIIVPAPAGPYTIPGHVIHQAANAAQSGEARAAPEQRQSEQKPEEHGGWVQVLLCYHECEGDPTPVLAGDCNTTQLCAPGTIREQFRIEFREGRAPHPDPDCRVPNVFANGQLDYASLARLITQHCPDLRNDPCILLANVRIVPEHGGHHCNQDNVDITVRPIVYTNDLLFELLLALMPERREQDYREQKG